MTNKTAQILSFPAPKMPLCWRVKTQDADNLTLAFRVIASSHTKASEIASNLHKNALCKSAICESRLNKHQQA